MNSYPSIGPTKFVDLKLYTDVFTKTVGDPILSKSQSKGGDRPAFLQFYTITDRESLNRIYVTIYDVIEPTLYIERVWNNTHTHREAVDKIYHGPLGTPEQFESLLRLVYHL